MNGRGSLVIFFLTLFLIGWNSPNSLYARSNTKIFLDKNEYCSGDSLVLTILNGEKLVAKDSVFFLSYRQLEELDFKPVIIGELHLNQAEGQFTIELPNTFEEKTAIEFLLSNSRNNSKSLIWKEKTWVNTLPEVSIDPLPKVCLNSAPISLNHGQPAGGRYFGPGVEDGKFDPVDLIPALFTIQYEYEAPNGCRARSSADIEILPVPEVESFPVTDSTYCLTDQPVILSKGLPKGGYLAGTGLGDSTFYPELAGPGLHKISYVIEKWGCTDSISSLFEVLPRPNFSFPTIPPICVGSDTIQLSAHPPGGRFSGEGVWQEEFHTRGLSQGSYEITYELENVRCPDKERFQVELVSMETPPLIQSNGDSLWLDVKHHGIQWWLDGEPLEGELRPYIRPEKDGIYRVNIKGQEGCEAFSQPIEWKLTPAIVENRLLDEWSIFPNPAKDYAIINWRNNFKANSEIRIYTSAGQLIKRQVLPEDSNIYVLVVDNWESGIYIAKIKAGNLSTQRKIVVDHN
ncbi:MAG: T9SS type A sorting domain-containing protein [Bacteroidia bacterium]|nr:T9SS type A sorting domain-containing protein [Bacteroidia bacterium]